MNVVPIDSAPSEGLPFAAKADTEGTDLFSILMASIAAANIPQQGSYKASLDGMTDLTGVATFSYGNGLPQASDKEMGVDALAKDVVAEETAVLMPIQFFSESADPLLANEAKSELPDIVEASFLDENPLLIKQQQPHTFDFAQGKLDPFSDGEEAVFVPLLPQGESMSEEAAGNFFQPDSEALETKTGAFTATQPFLQQIPKGAKTGDVMEGKEAGIAAMGKEIVAEKNAGARIEISPAVSQGTLDPRHTEISAKVVAVSGKGFQATQNPAIEPADLIAQVSGRIKADFKGDGGEVKMELHPESLGHLKIELRVEGGAVKANILTENAMVRDAIDSNLPMLKSSLEGHGLRIDQLFVGVDQRQSNGNLAERNGFHGWQESNERKTPFHEKDGTSDERWPRYAHQQEDGLSIFA